MSPMTASRVIEALLSTVCGASGWSTSHQRRKKQANATFADTRNLHIRTLAFEPPF